MTTTKILVIGGTGWIGKFMVEASAKAGHPTFALVRESTISNPSKSPIIQSFQNLGVNLALVRMCILSIYILMHQLYPLIIIGINISLDL